MRYRETFIIKHGERLILKGVDPAGKQHHESELGAKDEIEHYRSQLAKLQSLLYAEKKRSILVVLQAMDAGGKDGVVNHVLSVLKPTSFRDPRLGRSATNCRSRRFEATVAIWRSPCPSADAGAVVAPAGCKRINRSIRCRPHSTPSASRSRQTRRTP